MLADLVTWINQQSGITTLVSTRVYPDILPQKPTLPALTYTQVSAVRVHDLGGASGKARRRISIHSWADTHKGAHALADAVRQSLDGFFGWMADTKVGSVSLDNEFDSFEEDAGQKGVYRVIQDYVIAHLED